MIGLLLQYYGAANLIAFAAFALDHWIRIPERCLVVLAPSGGGVGVLLAMIVFKYRRRNTVLRITVPISIAVHTAVFLYLVLWEMGVVE